MFWFVEKILIGVESFGVMRNINELQRAKILNTKIFYTDYLPLESMSNLIPNPLIRTNMAKLLGMQFKFEYPVGSVVACIIWSAVFLTGSYYILKKKDW